MRILLLPTIAALLFTTGCEGDVASIHPYFAEKDLCDDPEIEKLLSNDGESNVKRVSIGKYLVCDVDERDCLQVHTFKIAGVLFVDAQQKASGLVIAPHYLFRPDFDRKVGDGSTLSGEGLKRLIDGRAINLTHAKIDKEGFLLTAETKDLHGFLQTHANDPVVFEEKSFGCTKLPPPPPPPPATPARDHRAQ